MMPSTVSPTTTWLEKAAVVADRCATYAGESDYEGAFPEREFQWLAEAGLLAAPLTHPPLAGRELLEILLHMGRGNLAVGRLYEGHVNALQLITRFETRGQRNRWQWDVQTNNHLFGVWNTEAQDGVRMQQLGDGRLRLAGAKTFCSGGTHVTRPLITGKLLRPDGTAAGWQMAIVPLNQVSVREDASFWQPLGMRASASVKIDFSGVELTEDDLLGAPDDYHQQPAFSGGAIRFTAVQLGGACALLNETRNFLNQSGRTEDPYQRQRLGQMATLVESGRLWLDGAARQLARPGEDADVIINYANMTRTAVEEICLRTMQLAERCVGARGLLRPHPFERIHRDLTHYLRQPAPDAALASVGTFVARQNNPSHAWDA